MKAFSKVFFFMLAAYASANAVQLQASASGPACPMDVKTCKDGRTVNRDPKKDCKFHKCKDAKPTRRPTRRPSRRPTRKPTRRPTNREPSTRNSSKGSKSSSRDNRSCVDDESPRPHHSDKGRFRFNLVKSNTRCVDRRSNLYEYGQFDKVKEFSDCAEACVNDVRSSLLESFRGYDWDCKRELCRCLYDRGALDSRNSDRFDRTNRSNSGDGSIEGTEDSRDYYCAKLAGAELLGDEFIESVEM